MGFADTFACSINNRGLAKATGDARWGSGRVVVEKGMILCMYGGCEMVGRPLPYPPPPPPLPHYQLLINVLPPHYNNNNNNYNYYYYYYYYHYYYYYYYYIK